jgi:hypothetical protein
MSKPSREEVDESAESEVTIFPDGRIYAFGITPTLVELLATIPMKDDRARQLLGRLGAPVIAGSPEKEEPAS